MTLNIILSIIFLGIGLSMDAFSVALTDGLTYTDINKRKAFFIAGTFGVMQALMPLTGFWLVELIETIAGSVAGEKAGQIASLVVVWLAFVLLLYLGIKMLVESIKEMKKPLEEKSERKFSIKEVLFYGFATAVDALAAGVVLHAGLSSTTLSYRFVLRKTNHEIIKRKIRDCRHCWWYYSYLTRGLGSDFPLLTDLIIFS